MEEQSNAEALEDVEVMESAPEEDEEDNDDDNDDLDETTEPALEVVVDEFGHIVRRPYKPFIDRILEASEETQGYYNQIKNELLSYKKIKARLSKKCDSFRLGRVLQAKVAMSGKTLKLYLSLNPADFDVNIYHHKDMSHKKSCQLVPLLVKVKSRRGCKRAIDLITILMSNNNVLKNPKYELKDYIKELLNLKGVEEIEVIDEAPVEEEVVVVDTPVEEPVVEETPVLEATEEVVEEEVVEEATEESETAEPELEEATPFASIEKKPYKPFVNRIAESNENTQEFYNTIKNELLSYRKIRCRTSRKGESFRLSRELQAKLTMGGTTLRLYLSLDPKEFDTKYYFHKDMSHKKAYAQTPLLMKLKSRRSVKRSIELISKLMESKDVQKKSRYKETNHVEKILASLEPVEE